MNENKQFCIPIHQVLQTYTINSSEEDLRPDRKWVNVTYIHWCHRKLVRAITRHPVRPGSANIQHQLFLERPQTRSKMGDLDLHFKSHRGHQKLVGATTCHHLTPRSTSSLFVKTSNQVENGWPWPIFSMSQSSLKTCWRDKSLPLIKHPGLQTATPPRKTFDQVENGWPWPTFSRSLRSPKTCQCHNSTPHYTRFFKRTTHYTRFFNVHHKLF
jgi:hypothetical protein